MQPPPANSITPSPPAHNSPSPDLSPPRSLKRSRHQSDEDGRSISSRFTDDSLGDMSPLSSLATSSSADSEGFSSPVSSPPALVTLGALSSLLNEWQARDSPPTHVAD